MKFFWKPPKGPAILITLDRIKKGYTDEKLYMLSFPARSNPLLSHLEDHESSAEELMMESLYSVLEREGRGVPEDLRHKPNPLDDYLPPEGPGNRNKGKNRIIPNENNLTYFVDKRRAYFQSDSEEYNSLLKAGLLHFMQSQVHNITFDNDAPPFDKNRQECFELFGNEFLTSDELKKYNDIKKIMTNIEGYKNLGNKFFFFEKHADRQTTLNELASVIEPILAKKILEPEDYEQIATQLVIAKNNTIASHKKNSTMGSIGITSSRLADALDKSLKELVSQGLLIQAVLTKIEQDNQSHQEQQAAPH